MITVKKLERFSVEDQKSFGFNGFETNKTYVVEKQETAEGLTISIKIQNLETPFKKQWSSNMESHKLFNEVIKEGLSLGAYVGEQLVGILIVTEIKWNNSLWIENIIISEEHRGNGVGKVLMENLMSLAKQKKIRIVGLETQSTNYPAIQFYIKNGFEIDGIDFSLYPAREEGKNDTAIIMKRRVQ